MGANKTPIFTRVYDFLTWLLPVTNGFPAIQRQTRIAEDSGKNLGLLVVARSRLGETTRSDD
jgi:hypothetical protein